MNKDLGAVLSGILLMTGLWVIFKHGLEWYYLIVLLFFVVFVQGLLLRFSSSKRKNTPKKASKKSTHENKNNRPQNENNIIRPEKEILTLPLEQLTWREFEKLCYLYYKAKGYKPIETKNGPDGGVDLIIYNRYHRQNIAIQIKHWIESGNRVGVKEIRELDSAKKNHKCLLAEFISSTGYTKDALVEADRRKIECHTADKILKWREQEAIKKNLA